MQNSFPGLLAWDFAIPRRGNLLVLTDETHEIAPKKNKFRGCSDHQEAPSTRQEWSGQGAASSSPQGATVP